jgi:hypothetical protein
VVADRPKNPSDDVLTPVEKRLARSFVDPESGYGKPLSRRTRQTKRTVESYLKAGVMPRYMERLREIETGLRTERKRIERSYQELLEECGHDRDAFARRWRARVRSWRFDKLNDLIREHNEWYPIEANLPMDPRTRDYVLIRGRSYRRPILSSTWVLEHWPARPRRDEAAA